ncbi:MAG TPA: hypothetical protein VG826_05560 [Pirellulales bacterium]|nr:hypothetical protein [Pirellulales bacterium]
MIQPDGSFEIRAPGLNHLYVNGSRDDPRCPREITVEVRDGETIEVDLPTLWAER